MIQTTKKHFVTGFRINGVNFKSYSIRLFNYAIIFYWGSVLDKKISLYYQTYKLN